MAKKNEEERVYLVVKEGEKVPEELVELVKIARRFRRIDTTIKELQEKRESLRKEIIKFAEKFSLKGIRDETEEFVLTLALKAIPNPEKLRELFGDELYYGRILKEGRGVIEINLPLVGQSGVVSPEALVLLMKNALLGLGINPESISISLKEKASKVKKEEIKRILGSVPSQIFNINWEISVRPLAKG